jgi:8-oxo-dGTP pyrophosphatase MutT (NUDIX family)
MAPRPRATVDPATAADAFLPAAALLLLYHIEGDWHVPLTLRGASLRHHGGQVSLPGGRLDPGETAEQTALREAFEEIGVIPANVDVLGRLTAVPIAVSGHLLQPVVGYAPHRPAFVVGEHEVERIIEVPVTRLRAPDAIGWEVRPRSLVPLESMDVPFFDVAGVRVWGATAMVLAELLAVLDSLNAALSPGQ